MVHTSVFHLVIISLLNLWNFFEVMGLYLYCFLARLLRIISLRRKIFSRMFRVSLIQSPKPLLRCIIFLAIQCRLEKRCAYKWHIMILSLYGCLAKQLFCILNWIYLGIITLVMTQWYRYLKKQSIQLISSWNAWYLMILIQMITLEIMVDTFLQNLDNTCLH